MAKVTSQSEVRLSGRLGDKVYSPYYGTTYVRRMPAVGKDVHTAAQLFFVSNDNWNYSFSCVFAL